MLLASDSIPKEILIPILSGQVTGIVALAILIVRLREKVAKLEEHVKMMNGGDKDR